jgi:hypothetical protein
MQPPPGRLAPYLLVEVFQNARTLFWRQCGLFSDRLDSSTCPPGAAAVFISLTPSAGESACKDYAAAGIVVDLMPPCCIVMISVTMASTSPAPGVPRPLSRQNRSKICFRCLTADLAQKDVNIFELFCQTSCSCSAISACRSIFQRNKRGLSQKRRDNFEKRSQSGQIIA